MAVRSSREIVLFIRSILLSMYFPYGCSSYYYHAAAEKSIYMFCI